MQCWSLPSSLQDVRGQLWLGRKGEGSPSSSGRGWCGICAPQSAPDIASREPLHGEQLAVSVFPTAIEWQWDRTASANKDSLHAALYLKQQSTPQDSKDYLQRNHKSWKPAHSENWYGSACFMGLHMWLLSMLYRVILQAVPKWFPKGSCKIYWDCRNGPSWVSFWILQVSS